LEVNIAVLFDGAGLARLGLEQAGHTCTGYELDPWKHYLSQFVGSGNSVLADVRDVDLSPYDAVWASPPCQWHSSARTQGDPVSGFATDLLEWSLNLDVGVLWVENIMSQTASLNTWGTKYNAAQFLSVPIQNRNRIVGGHYREPFVYASYRRTFAGICPCITASEYKGCASDTRRASRYYGRRLTVGECADHQGLTIPPEWHTVPEGFTPGRWRQNLYEAIGNGVPVYMARGFGEMYPAKSRGL
jgi:site-specific DNA-cytosine methylase